VRFGVRLGHGDAYSGDYVRLVARTAEELGFSSIWCSEHMAIPMSFESRYPYSPSGKPEFYEHMAFGTAMVTLAHAAAVTSTVRLSTCVIPLMAHHPVALAKDAATLDCLCGGRLELGLGAGWLKEEAQILGLASDHPAGRLEEAIELMRSAWATSPYEFDGAYWQVPPVVSRPLPPQRAELPIWIGGTSPRAVSLARRKATGLVVAQREAHKVGELRSELPVETKIAIGIAFAPDFGVDPVREQLDQLLLARIDTVILQCNADLDSTIAALGSFARKVLPYYRGDGDHGSAS